MDNTLTAPTVTTWKYPHPDAHNTAQEQAAQVARIRAMVGELARLDAALFDAARDFAKMHQDDLDAVETHIRQVLDMLTAAADRQQENELRNQ